MRTTLWWTTVVVALLAGGPLLVPTPSLSDVVPPRELADEHSRFATIEGLEVHHEVRGEPADPTVLLLHHFYGNTRTWRHVLDGLADRYQVAAYDRPGFGLTERPARAEWDGRGNPYTREASARITLGMLDELGAQRGVLVGSSAGGTAALEAYARAPERVSALVLVSPAITGDIGPPGAWRPLLRSPQGRRLGPYLVRRVGAEVDTARVGRSWADPSRTTAADVAAYTRPLRAERWDQALWELFTAEDPPDLRELLARIEVPTLVVAGDADPVISARWNRRTAAAIPGAEFAELPGCGHTPQEECPDALIAAVGDFLDRL